MKKMYKLLAAGCLLLAVVSLSSCLSDNDDNSEAEKEWQEWYKGFQAEVAASHGPYAGYVYYQPDAKSEEVDSIAAEWDIANDSLMVLRNVPTRLFVQKLPENQSSLKEAILALNTVDVRVKIIFNVYYKSPLLFYVYPEPVTLNINVDGQPKTAVVNFMNFETANQSYGQVMVSDGRCAVNVFLENIVVDKSIVKTFSSYDYVYLNWFGRRR